jgi:DNA-directed RNA polymerase subunit RPC12/RpoP
MARVRLVCGSCGADVAPGSTRCAACGTELENADAVVRCTVCGHPNAGDVVLCASCGARLPGADAPGRVKEKGSRSGAPPEKKKRAEAGPRGISFRWWQTALLAAAGAGIVYLAVSPTPAPAPQSTAPQGVAPQLVPGLGAAPMVDVRPFEEAVRSGPADLAARLRLANAYHDAGRYQDAIGTYRTYLETRPADADARVDMGICYYELGRQDSAASPQMFGEAVRAMSEAFRRNPRHQPAAFNLGIVHLSMGKIDESTAWFRKAAALDSTTELGKRAHRMLEQHSF